MRNFKNFKMNQLLLRYEQTEHLLHMKSTIPNVSHVYQRYVMNLPKPNLSKVSYVSNQTHRQFLAFETGLTEQTDNTDSFLRGKPNIPNIFASFLFCILK